MRSIDTINLVRTCLAHLTSTDASAHPEASTRPETSAPPRDKSRLVLALLCMAMDAERIFDCTVRGDKVMKREAKRFEAKLIAALSPSRAVESGESVAASLHRAKRFYAAWSASDKPRTLDQLMASVVATSAHQRQHGMAAAPPEETFAHIRGVGGAEAEAEARRRFDGAWQTVRTTADLEATVASIAQRAFWDALAEQVNEGKYEALFSVLGEMQQAMTALVAHSPRLVEELNDCFDAEWLKQQADHGALEVGSVHRLMRYLATTIGEWQAPADEAEARAWVEASESALRSGAHMQELTAFIAAHLVPFLKGATERLGQVYKRTVDYFEQHEAERRAREQNAPSQLDQQD